MIKNVFNSWNQLKQRIHNKKKISRINEREVCFVNLGKNIGYEQDGKNNLFERPVIVLKKFGLNTFIGLPLTSQKKSGKFYFPFTFHEKESFVILSQIRLFDVKRIARKMGYMPKNDFEKMKEKLKNLLSL